MLLVLLMVELTPLTETSIVQIVEYTVFLAHVLHFILVKQPLHSLRDLMNILSLLEKLCMIIHYSALLRTGSTDFARFDVNGYSSESDRLYKARFCIKPSSVIHF